MAMKPPSPAAPPDRPIQVSLEGVAVGNERQFTNPEHLKLLIIGPHPGFEILRLRSYPAWRVMVNGSPVSAIPTREDGLTAIPLPQGPVQLSADWTTTPDVVAGRWVSALAVLLLIGLGIFERRLARLRVS